MKKLVVLNLNGSLEEGIIVSLRVGEDDGTRFGTEINGNLSPALTVKSAYTEGSNAKK